MFYRKAALSTNKSFVRKRNNKVIADSDIGKRTDLQKPHVPYMEPLIKFFHDSIDFERVLEINRQELVLQDDFSVF